jgi:hypothetical protein
VSGAANPSHRNPEILSPLGPAGHSLNKTFPVEPKENPNSKDVVTATQALHHALSVPLGASVGPPGTDGIVLGIGTIPGSIEDVVGGDVHQLRPVLLSGHSEIPCPQSIHLVGPIRIFFAAIYIGHGGGIDHQIRAFPPHGLSHRLGIGDIEIPVSKGHDIEVLLEGLPDILAQHSLGADKHEHPMHGFLSLKVAPSA